MACGGWDTETTCVQLVDGEWITSHDELQTRHVGQVSWSPQDTGDVLLMGAGVDSDMKTTELVKIDGSESAPDFELQHSLMYIHRYIIKTQV